MDECTAFFGDSIVLSTIDANSSPYQVEVKVSDSDKTPVTSLHELYYFLEYLSSWKTDREHFNTQ